MNQANNFVLTGEHVHVTYSATSITGKPLLRYQDAHISMSFEGDAIRTVESDVGTLVSVTLMTTVDSGSTTFTLIVPHVNIDSGSAPVHTYGLRTIHRFSLVPALMSGQLDTSRVCALHGTAAFVFA